jgi:hypothetical protein
MAVGLGRCRHIVAVASGGGGLGYPFMVPAGCRARFAHGHRERCEGQGHCNHKGEEKAYAHARSYGRKAIYWQRHRLFITPGLALSGEYVYDMGDAAASVFQAVCAAWTAPLWMAPGAQVEERRIC